MPDDGGPCRGTFVASAVWRTRFLRMPDQGDGVVTGDETTFRGRDVCPRGVVPARRGRGGGDAFAVRDGGGSRQAAHPEHLVFPRDLPGVGLAVPADLERADRR